MKTINMKSTRIIASILGCFLFYGLSVASAAPVKWAENGHYYESIIDAPYMSWEEARDWASEQNYTDDSGQLYNGYLATITSAKESDFIATLPLIDEVPYLLGGYQTPGTGETTQAEKQAEWHWVTGEAWSYTNWLDDEPDNFYTLTGGHSEEYLQYIPESPPPITMPYLGNTPAGWNDVYMGSYTGDNGEQLLGSSYLIVEYEPASEPASDTQDPDELLMVITEGKDVTADWSSMPEAQSYTLYYALADYKGDVDIETLGSINMGQAQTIFVANLPSGVTFYLAIMAHTSEGDVLSNIVKFMPFGGSVTYPETGDILMQIDDPEGIGNISIIGTRNDAGLDDLISEIRGKNDKGSYVLYLTDNKITSYEEAGFTINYTYQADGTAISDIILNNSQTRILKAIPSNTIDCSQYENIDEYLNTVDNTISSKSQTISLNHHRTLIKLTALRALFLKVSVESEYYQENIQKYFDTHGYRATAEDFLNSNPKFKAYQTIDSGLQLVKLTAPTSDEAYKDVKQEYADNYNKQCNDTPSPATPTEIAMAEIDFDYECPIPEGAVYREIHRGIPFINDGLLEYYVGSNNKVVGPMQTWDFDENGILYLYLKQCYNTENTKRGWQLRFLPDGQIYYVNYFSDTYTIHYHFYENGILKKYTQYENHDKTLQRNYLEDGTLSFECIGSDC